MPGVKNTQKRTSKKAVAAKRNNDKTISSLLEGDNHFILGRVDKNLGASFQVIVDGGSIMGTPRRTFTKSTMPIEANSFVVLEPSATGRAKVLEIVGVLSRGDAQQLYKAKRMSKKVWSVEEENEENDIFDYEDEEEEIGADGDVKEDKQAKTKTVEVDSDDIDIDAI
jgi:hypothetical protein